MNWRKFDPSQILVMPWHLLVGTEKATIRTSVSIADVTAEIYQSPPEYKSRTFPID
jgi:hypothetical protein